HDTSTLSSSTVFPAHIIQRIQDRHIILFFFFNDPATTQLYTLSLHDALPIYRRSPGHQEIPYDMLVLALGVAPDTTTAPGVEERSEEHTSELQSRFDLVCRLLLEKKKKFTENNN